MDTSKTQKTQSARPAHRAILGAELLEGRRLLSTAAVTPATAAAVPAAAPTPWAQFHFPMNPPTNAMPTSVAAAGGYGGPDMSFGMGAGSEMSSNMMPGRFGRMHHFAMQDTTSASASTTPSTAATATAAAATTPTTTTAATPATATSTGMPAMSSTTAPTGSSGMGMGMDFGGGRGFDRGRGFGFDGSSTMMKGHAGAAAAGTAAATAFKQIRTDTQAIADKSQVTPALQAALRKDLEAIQKDVTVAPSDATTLALQSDVSSIAGSLPSSATLATLQTDFTAAATSAGVTDSTLIGQTFTDLNAVIAASNVTSADVATLDADLKAAGLSTSMPLPLNLGVDFDALARSLTYVAPAATTPVTPVTPTTTPTTTTTSTS